MALIGKIRKHMWLVIVLLALALAGFIIMDMTSASNRGGFGSKTTIGKVDGEKIDYKDFQVAESALYSGSGDVYGRKNSLWNYFVENAILDKISNANGIGVGQDELAELEFGTNLSPVVQSFYRNPQTGQVDRNQLNEIKTAIDEGKVTNPEFITRFNELRKQVIKSAKQTKLSNMVSKAMYTPTWMAETMDKINGETASMEYVKIPFDVIQDSEVTVSDEDISNYIKENATKYTNKEEVRNLSYVVYNVKATAEDSMNIKNGLDSLKNKFAAATNDSLFTATNGGYYGDSYAKKDELTGPLKEAVSTMSLGQVYGPYIDNSAYVLAKLVNKKVIADSASAAHILRRVAPGDAIQLAAAQKYIDSLKTIINSGTMSFSDAAAANSQDESNASKGGDLGTFAPGMMVKEFNDVVFGGKDGSVYSVTTQFGVHLLKVNKLVYKTNELKYNMAYIAQPIIPSEATQNAILDKVLASLETTKKIEDLTKLASGDVKIENVGSIKKNDFTFANLGSGQTSRDIVKWAYDKNTKVGDVSSTAYTYTDDANYVDSKYVVVGLKSIDKAGLGTVEGLRNTVEPLIKNKKKGELIKSRISGTDLAGIAATFGQTPMTLDAITFGRVNFGSPEPMVSGKAFALAAGTTSEALIGNGGVYLVKINSKTEATPENGSFGQKMMQTQSARMQVNYKLMDAIKKTIKTEDNRSTYF